MELKDILVMDVPAPALKHVVKENKLKPGGHSVEDYAETIVRNAVTLPVGKILADQFEFAGSTAVNWFEPLGVNSTTCTSQAALVAFLQNKFGGNIFTSGIRPTVNDTPKLFMAKQTGNNVILGFTYYGPGHKTIENFQVVTRNPQMIDYVIMHFNPFILEFRADVKNLKKFQSVVLDVLSLDKDKIVWDKVNVISEAEAEELCNRLNAGLSGAKHQMIEGPYATKEVHAHKDVENLRESPVYQSEFSGHPVKKQSCIFAYTYSFGLEQKITFVITDDGGLWFRTSVGEEVIKYVMGHILQIRAKRTQAKSA